MQDCIDCALWEVSPEDYFLEFVRGLVARAGAARSGELEVLERADAPPDRLLLYACEHARRETLAAEQGEFFRPCADPLSACASAGGHAGWAARLGALAGAPAEQPTVFGRTFGELRALAAAPAAFAPRLGGAAADWDTLLRALAAHYGPEAPARAQRPDPALWAWADSALAVLAAAALYHSGAPEVAHLPPEWLLARPQLSGGALVLGGVLPQVAAERADLAAPGPVPAAAFPQLDAVLRYARADPPATALEPGAEK